MKESSMVDAVNYNADAQTMTVKFKSSPTPYVYSGVPPKVYDNLEKAESVGRYLNEHVTHQYKFERG